MGTERPLRICALGNANNVAVQINTRSFARRGHEVAILSPVPAAVRDLEVLTPRAGHATTRHRGSSYLQMIRLLHRWRPDVVLVHFASYPFNWLLPLVWFKPLFVTLAGGDILFHQRPGLSPRRQRATLGVLEIADGIISRSDYMLAPYPRLQQKAIVSPWGVDLDLFASARPPRRFTPDALGLAAGTPVILSPRRLVPVCGVATIVDALPRIRERVPGAVLLVMDDVPDAAYRREVVERIERLGLGDAIRLLHSVDHDDMPDLYQIADVTVSVARSDGISLAVLESMAARTPVVLGDIPNYTGIFADGRHCKLVDPRDPSAIAAGVAEVLSDNRLRAAVIEGAYAKVVDYADLARETMRIEGLMRRFVGASRSLRLMARARQMLNLALIAFEPDAKDAALD